MIRVKKGLNLPLAGTPSQVIHKGPSVTEVAITGPDYVGMKPTMLVKPGDRVRIGDPLFACKKTTGVVFTSPGAGTVKEINRGEKRAFLSLVITLDSEEEHREFKSYNSDQIDGLSREDVSSLLQESGLWSSLRTRPFSRAASPMAVPHSIFVTAIDTNPLTLDPGLVIKEHLNEYDLGLKLLTKLTDGPVHHCISDKLVVPGEGIKGVRTTVFDGPHPAGNVGTHIHFLDPVGEEKSVWHIGYQDVIAIGKLFLNGKLWNTRYVALGGAMALKPRVIETRLGAHLPSLMDGELRAGPSRVISGSVLSGRKLEGKLAYLGRFHNQITTIPEDSHRRMLGWIWPGSNTHSVSNTFLSKLFPKRKLPFSTNIHGSHRPIVPIGLFEKVMPLDILPTQLLKALSVDDIESSIKLGCLELDEEDLALCTYACSGKNDYGVLLRENLTIIEKEGV